MQKVIIFDMDGTLLYTLEDLRLAVNSALEAFGYTPRSLEEIRQFVGNGVVKLIQRALPDGMENPQFKLVFNEFINAYERIKDTHTQPYEGVLSLLDTLKSLGYRLAVNSNKYDVAVKSLCEKYFPQIDIAIGAREGVEVKPAPDGVFDIFKSFGNEKFEGYFVGDSDVDVMTAKNSGLISVGVTWGYRSRESLVLAGADYVIDTPAELLKFVG